MPVTLEQALFLVILAAALALFISEKLRVDLVAMLTALALTLTGLLEPREALSGFSSEPAIIVASVFVLSAGLSSTGITERIGAAIGRAAGRNEWRAIAVLMPATAMMAAFSHHLMVTAMMLPVVLRIARDSGIAASRLLMPMSLAASLGTTLTLISAPAFLLASNQLRQHGQPPMDLFTFTPIGAALVLIGSLFMLLGKGLLPRRQGESADDYLKLDRYYTELLVDDDSSWIGRSLGEFRKHFKGRLETVDWLRHGERLANQPEDCELQGGDVLLVRATPEQIAALRDDEPGLSLHAVAKYGDGDGEKTPGHETLVQAVVAPRSEFIGRTVAAIDFVRSFDVVVVGLWRRDGWLHGELSELVLREGDLMVLSGHPDAFATLGGNRNFLLLIPFQAEARTPRRAPVALAILLATIAAAASEIVAPQVAFLTGAALMVLAGCTTLARAYREIDVRIYVMIAGVIPLGMAMDRTGTADLLAGLLADHAQGLPQLTLLLLLFAAAALLTQILSDAATTVLLVPIALSLADSLGLPPLPLVICIAMGAVASFLTPIGHHGNLLILNPGQYRFADFLRVGIPLTTLIALTVAWLAQWLWMR
ncbi:SLC13 family permease [Lysobacter sp.]|uniref:SLC13 family permease n=1 Tax=Lysobacter sp. TaxID=72226 RepID=UPI002D69FA11|nr:SLC13 family permease [Lysobacter sp.]HZX77077.1 SLC13 family permease [Lysobacter sp.]